MGPIMLGRMAIKERLHLRSTGKGFFEINRIMENFDSSVLHGAVAEADIVNPGTAAAFYKVAAIEPPPATVTDVPGPQGGTVQNVKAFGDGSILKQLVAAFEAFANSAFGKAVIAALEKLLLGLLIA